MKRWAPSELHFARTQRAAGVPLKVIARKLGRNWDAIRLKLEYEARKAQPPRRTPPRYQWSEADDLVAAKAWLRVEIEQARAEWSSTAPNKAPITW